MVRTPPRACSPGERAAQIDRMLDAGVIELTQAELFETRAEAMCLAEPQERNALPAG
jgi:hypothetical protein